MTTAGEDKPELTGWDAYKRLLGYVREFWVYILISILGYATYAGTQAAFALLMEFIPAALEPTSGEVPDSLLLPEFIRVQMGTPESYQLFIPLALVTIVACRSLGSYFGGFYLILVARKLINNLRTDLFNRLLVLPGAYYSRNSSAHLISTLTFNVEQVTGAATDALKVLLRDGITVVVLLCALFYMNWKLSLVFLMIGPVIGLVISIATRLFRKYSRRIQDSMGGVTHVATETIKGFQVVRAFGGARYERERFRRVNDYNLKQSTKMARLSEISTPFIQFLTFSSLSLIFYIGLSPELKGGMGTGEFLAYITAASLVAKPLRSLTSVNSKIQRGIAAAVSIFEIVDTEEEVDEGRLALTDPRGEIEFRDLSFGYENGQGQVLKKVNLSIAPGQTVAIVGRSGSGKSTLVNLLPRFNEVPEKSIYLDGQPLESYRLADLRRHIAVVNQHIVLFQDTVAGNIAYGDLAGASEQEIRAAATAAHAVEFIDTLSEGMNTPVGEDGIMLSGGQRQRLALARAFLKDAKILVLDEATSALDTESERYIQDALQTIMQGRTTLVIAHRLSTIEKADKIVVLEEGRVVETGTHQALLERRGSYAQLHKIQFGLAEPALNPGTDDEAGDE